jgi:hypothetical protein
LIFYKAETASGRSQWPSKMRHYLSSPAHSHSSHGCLYAFVLCLSCPVFRPCFGLITRPRSPTIVNRIKNLKKQRTNSPKRAVESLIFAMDAGVKNAWRYAYTAPWFVVAWCSIKNNHSFTMWRTRSVQCRGRPEIFLFGLHLSPGFVYLFISVVMWKSMQAAVSIVQISDWENCSASVTQRIFHICGTVELQKFAVAACRNLCTAVVTATELPTFLAVFCSWISEN